MKLISPAAITLSCIERSVFSMSAMIPDLLQWVPSYGFSAVVIQEEVLELFHAYSVKVLDSKSSLFNPMVKLNSLLSK